MNINIVNKKTHKPEACDVYVDRPSVLGNPYPETEYGILLYRDEFQRLMMHKKDTEHMNYNFVNLGLIDIQNMHKRYGKVNLVCWCTCHASVIVEYLVQNWRIRWRITNCS
jgi:hypothetical protein